MQKINNEEIIHNLKKTFFFSEMDDAFFEMAAPHFRQKSLQKSAAIDSDETLKYFYVIIEGNVKTSYFNPENARSITPFLLSEYEVFDIVPVIDKKENMIDYIALDTCILLQIEAHYIRSWIEKYPQLNTNLLQCLAKKFREMEEFSRSLVFYDTKTRLANLLLKHAIKEQKNRSSKITKKLSHETLSEMIGSVRSIVTRDLQELKREGVILDKRATIIVNNLEKLKERCAKYINL